MLEVFCDASFKSKKRGSTISLVIKQQSYILHASNKKTFASSSNEAELLALFNAFNHLLEDFSTKNYECIKIMSDSQSIVDSILLAKKKMRGINKTTLSEIINKFQKLKNITNIDLVWIPRTLNKEADYLSRLSCIEEYKPINIKKDNQDFKVPFGTQKIVHINEVKIPNFFKNTSPREEKIKDAIDYFSQNGMIDKPITVSLENTMLLDEYARYLALKRIAVNYIPIRFGKNKRTF